LPTRKDRTNKSDFGRLVVMAGSENMWGAGILAAQSAYRMGAGYVTWAGRDLPIEKLEQTPEVLTAALDDEKIWKTKTISAYAVGPGLGVSEETAQLIRRLKNLKAEKVVLDADALTVCAKYKLFPLPKTWVITPHAAELARLIQMDVKEIENDRFGAALAAAKKVGCHVLLKGYRSVLAYEKRCMVISAGNSALAKAGSGDVLTGMIGGLLAQGLDTLQATATAAFIHGRLADEWLRMGFDKRALNPSDLKDSLSSMLSRIAQGAIF
jgi:ADP-dependent NAD(P)H-hydrate dehydratase